MNKESMKINGKLVTLTSAMAMSMGLSICASAATYYVSPNGNDGSSGSSSQPWRTPQHAADKAVGGDTVLFKDGTYSLSEQWRFTRKGTAGSPITFKAENTHKRILPIPPIAARMQRYQLAPSAMVDGWKTRSFTLLLRDWI